MPALGPAEVSRAERGYIVDTLAVLERFMKTRIVRVGNSRGVRLPKALLDEAGLPDEVELLAEPGRIVIEAARRPRAGWAEAAQAMAGRGDDALLDPPSATRFDDEEWTW